MRPWVPRDAGTRVLELGCGSGQLLRQLRAGGLTDLTGVDRTQSQIDAALGHDDEIDYVVEDAMVYLAAHQGCFDLICAFDFIEHLTLDEALEVCDLVHGSLAPHGRFVLRTPNAASLLGNYGWHADATHMTQYTEYSLFQLLDAAGFGDHQILKSARPKIGLSALRHPSRSFLRAWVNRIMHQAAYWARAQQGPTCYDSNLEVWTVRT